MSAKNNMRLDKLLPTNIKATLSYINNVLFPFDVDKISDEEMSYIMTRFIRSGKTLQEIKTDIINILDGKNNELSSFVESYPTRNNNQRENIIMLFMGIIISILILLLIITTDKNRLFFYTNH